MPQLILARGPHRAGPQPKGAAHLGSAGFGDRQSKNAKGRKTGILGQLASPERHPGEPVPLHWNVFWGEGLGWSREHPS